MVEELSELENWTFKAARTAFENGRISAEEADELIRQLGFQRGLEEI